MATLLSTTTYQGRKADGTPNALGKVYTYAAGTLTPQASYTTAALSVENTNPVILGADGCAAIHLDPSLAYRIREYTSADVLIRETDNYSDAAGGSGGRYVFGVESQTAVAGQTVVDLDEISYTVGTGSLMVAVDGMDVTEFTENTSTRFTFDEPLQAGQEITARGGQYVTGGIKASEISTIGDYTGAIARTQQQRNDDRLTSKDLDIGAHRTASYNRGALQAAVDSGLGRLDIIANYPGETMLVNGVIDVPNHMEIEGIGRWSCNISSTALSSPIFRFDDSNTYNALRGLHLSYSGTPLSGANAIECNGNSGLDLYRMTISSCWNGIYLYGGASGIAGNHELVGLRVWSYEQCGLLVDGGIDINLSVFRMSAFARPGSLGGIRLLGGVEAFTASQGDITLGQYGLTCDTNGAGGRGNSPWFNRFSKVYFDSTLYSPAYLRRAAHTDFIGCWFASGGHAAADTGYTALGDYPGVDMENCEHISFIGGDCYGNGGNGINVFSGNLHTSIDGMRFRRNGRWRSADRAGVNVLAGTTDFSITNCTFQRDADTTEYRQRTGVNVNTGASDRYIVTGNKWGSCNLVDGGTGIDKSVTGNVGAA